MGVSFFLSEKSSDTVGEFDFNDFRPTSHAVLEIEQYHAYNFDRICVSFWLTLLTDRNSPTVSLRFLDILAVIKSVAYHTFDRLLAHCRTSFCHIHRPKAASPDWQELAAMLSLT